MPTPKRDPGAFDVDKAMTHVRKLAITIGIREAGTIGDQAAADYIEGEITKLGWRVEQRRFPLPKGGTSSNVVGIPPGFDATKPYLMVGGHRDSLRGPGANDNATGIAVSLEVARAVAARPAVLPVLFVAFGAEERETDPLRSHHVGSRDYVGKMTEAEKANLVDFVNIDMVGWGTFIWCPRLPVVGPHEGADRCLAQGRKLGIDVRDRIFPNYSDHGTFVLAHMNAGWLWAGDDTCCNHSPRDTMARVKRDSVDRAGRIALAMIRSYR